MFKPLPKRKLRVALKGLLARPIQYEVRVPEANWSPFFGKYLNQKWGSWDTNSCWLASSVNCLEDQLEWLWKNNMFGQEAKDFFTKNGYIDSDGDFSISERYLEILGGELENGGTAPEAWQLMQKWGCIPRSMLTFTLAESWQATNTQAFDEDYFSVIAVTDKMKALGQEFLKHVNVSYQKIGKNWYTPARVILEAALKQAPLNIGIPVPADPFNWNKTVVLYEGQKMPQHEVELYGIDTDGGYLIFDQYLPNCKKLSPDYYIPLVTQGIVNPVKKVAVNPIVQPQGEMNVDFWTRVMNFWNNIFSSIPIGHS